MYTATLKNRVIEGGRIRWVVEFTNGTDVFSDSFNVNKFVNLQTQVASKLAELNFVDTFTIDAVIDSTVAVSTPPTQAEIDKATWMQDWRILTAADNLITHGVITNTLPAYVAHKAKVVANFKPAYLTSLF